jgi:hypothetical protein
LSPALSLAAAFSVWAHLRRLHELGRVECDDPDELGARWEAHSGTPAGAGEGFAHVL